MTGLPEIDREYNRLLRLAFPKRHRGYTRRWRNANIESQRAIDRRRGRRAYIKFRIEVLMCRQLMGLAFQDHIRAIKRRSWARNCQKRRAEVRDWMDRHPAHTTRTRIKRLSLLTADPKDLRSIEKIYARARELRRWFNVVVDHIKPLIKGGPHAPSNLQIIYRSENERKAARLDYIPSVVFQ